MASAHRRFIVVANILTPATVAERPGEISWNHPVYASGGAKRCGRAQRRVSAPIYTSSVTESLASLDWYGFLGRQPLAGPGREELRVLGGARVLVTGAGGSIGAALALRLASLGPAKLVLLEASESHLFALQNEFAEHAPDAPAVFVLGGVHDAALLDELFAEHAPRLVFHAAAYKHVPLMEEQPLAAMANNIFATRALVEAASRHGARLVLLSTDKAVEPASVMGATKRVAEQMTLAAGGTAVRLGNVLASRDSVAETFAAALAAGRPVRVTDPAARRYFLTIDEAVNLLLTAALAGPGLFAAALDAPHFVADLARFLALSLEPDRHAEIEFTHPRSGEKQAERLWSARETARPALNGLMRIESPGVQRLDAMLSALEAAVTARDVLEALASLQRLVPDYTPSTAVRALAASHAQQVAR